ncbi:MAG: SRPBCC family protein [Gemmatimonadaceae bacterium]|nr:SRPBCC family protein [Gemmatimonadaceae bacterium]
MREPFSLGPLPAGRAMETVDERVVRAGVAEIFALARQVEHWPAYLPHYRFVRFRDRAQGGGGIVEMSANRPFGVLNWPTWWLSEMEVDEGRPAIRFRHIGGITTRMDVEWGFEALPNGEGTRVRLVHAWDGPHWPLIGIWAATVVIGPVFVHGIATRTLEGLARIAEGHLAPLLARADFLAEARANASRSPLT